MERRGGESGPAPHAQPCRRARSIPDHSIGPDRAVDVFEVLLAQIVELDPDFSSNVIVGSGRDADAAGLCNALKPCRDVNAVPENVVGLDDHVADVDSHTESNTRPSVIRDCKFLDTGLELHSSPNRLTALGNSAKKPSPVFFTIRPPCSEIAGMTPSARSAVNFACVPLRHGA